MWKYLVFNVLWLAFLFLAAFTGGRLLRALTLVLILAGAFFAALRKGADPFGWFYYFAFSLVAFRSAAPFRRWALAKSVALEDELKLTAAARQKEESVLEEKTRVTQAVQDRADEISHLYEKTKEMSQSLDMLETFLVFGEALAKHLRFEVVRLALFDGEEKGTPPLREIYELRYSDFKEPFERSLFLKDKKRVTAPPYPLDEKIFGEIFRSRGPVRALEEAAAPFIAEPIFIHEKIFAVLTVMGVDKKDLPVLSILVERFISEAQRVKLYETVETLAITDGLTGVYVRRHLVERLREEIVRSKRFGFKLSFLMIDVDHFKQFNDQYGHLVGDVVLKQVAEAIKKNVREIDLAGRYGGEEFGILLIETDEAGALFVAERIRRAVSERIFKAYDESLKVTISVGCATYSESLNDADLLVDAADSALYQAKRQGRNRVCLLNLNP